MLLRPCELQDTAGTINPDEPLVVRITGDPDPDSFELFATDPDRVRSQTLDAHRYHRAALRHYDRHDPLPAAEYKKVVLMGDIVINEHRPTDEGRIRGTPCERCRKLTHR